MRPVETWRVKFFNGQIDEYLQVHKTNLVMGEPESVNVQHSVDDDQSPLTAKPKDWTDTGDADTSDKNTDQNGMATPALLQTPSLHKEYSASSRNNIPLKKSDASKENIEEIFSPKILINKKNSRVTPNKSFIHPQAKGDKAALRNCLTENAQEEELDPLELEKFRQLEISNEEDVDDPHKIDKRRFMNDDIMNIQSPVHHKIGSFFGSKEPVTTENPSPEKLQHKEHKHIEF